MANAQPRSRPISPHLQIFRPLITMVMSIVHRITGAALYFGMILLVIWLLALSTDRGSHAAMGDYLDSWLGLIILIGFSWALIHHGLGGVRHFIWDMGHGYDAIWRNRLAWWTIIASVSLTLILWIVALLLF
jgi:succinate dehydrogenase / fumarate reductase cytochrome b subunit